MERCDMAATKRTSATDHYPFLGFAVNMFPLTLRGQTRRQPVGVRYKPAPHCSDV